MAHHMARAMASSSIDLPDQVEASDSNLLPIGRTDGIAVATSWACDTCCGRRVTGRSKSLIVMSVLFTVITAAQYVAGTIARSVSLQADCVSMFLDVLSYLGNLAAECTVNPRLKEPIELAVSGTSFALLAGLTTWFIWTAVDGITAPPDEDEEAVNPHIVIGFAVLGLVFDALSLVAYRVWGSKAADDKKDQGSRGRKAGRATGSVKGASDSIVITGSHAAPPAGVAVRVSGGDADDGDNDAAHAGTVGPTTAADVDAATATKASRLNMLSALGHVLSDTLRSGTTLVEGIVLITHPTADSVAIDGWSALIVCSLIAIGALFGIVSWVLAVRRVCSTGGAVCSSGNPAAATGATAADAARAGASRELELSDPDTASGSQA